MTFLTIDENKCQRDGICVIECPRRIITQENAKSVPRIAPADEAGCMFCGHCVAACPHGALSVNGIHRDDCPKIEKRLQLSSEQAIQFLRSRRSIRWFKNKAVTRQELEQLIRIARYAPTASNAQNLQWTVIQGRDKLMRLSEQTIAWMERMIETQPNAPAITYFRSIVARWADGDDGILRTAQTLIVPSAPPENSNGLVDLCIALAYLELAALPLGIGTCWAGLLRGAMLANPELVDSMALPEEHTWFYPMMIGYPLFRYHRLPTRKPPVIHWR